ncbi:hypothetical protein [Micromonospora chersina]|uniref:hypothetical protein n=1 Tax=Micromonospora chersina TaxID=47854 RepID=UPI0033C4B024
MPRIELTTDVPAAPETVFDACLDVQLHTVSMGTSAERAVRGVTTGRSAAGDDVMRATSSTSPRRWEPSATSWPASSCGRTSDASSRAGTPVLPPPWRSFLARHGRTGKGTTGDGGTPPGVSGR